MQPTEHEDFTPSSVLCFDCGKPLIKQHLHHDKPLTNQQRKDLHLAMRSYAHTLECKECGDLCYVSVRDIPPKSGIGHCRNCAGQNTRKRPQSLLKLEEAARISNLYQAVIWSCPDHGTLPLNS